ncbi:hypothetical protein ACFL6E_01055 [Candidatus Neomarinimicrobiota bacterium]
MTEIYDAALKILADNGPEYDGYPNHGPVVAHTILELGRPAKVDSWVRDYQPALDQPPGPVEPITRHSFLPAIGKIERYTDWTNYLKREMREEQWTNLTEDWITQLAPGLSGAAGNAMIRTAHILKAVQSHSSSILINELAASLGYWFSSYRRLPGIAGGAKAGTLSPDTALGRIRWINKEGIPVYKTLGQGLTSVTGNPYFTGVINLIAIPTDLDQVVHAMTEAFCRVFLAHSTHPLARIPFMQAINVLSATRFLLPYLQTDASKIAMLRYAWQFAGGLYAVFGSSNPVDQFIPQPMDRERLVDQTLATGDEHIIRFVGSCLREYEHHESKVYFTTAWDAVNSYRPTAVLDESGIDSNLPYYRDF